MTKVKVGHLNCHNNERAVRVALSWGCDSLGLNEVGKTQYMTPGYRADKELLRTVDPRRTSLSTRVLVQQDYHNLGEIAMLASPPSTPERIAPGRWIKVAMYRKGGHDDFAHVAFHNHAMVDDRPESVDRVAKASRGFTLMRDVLVLLMHRHRVVLTGDLNSRDREMSLDWDDPGEIFRDLGFGYRNVGLDWVAWDKGALFMDDLKVIPREEVHSDHPGLVARLQTT